MTGILWALAIGAYVLGYVVSVVIVFRMFAADDLIGVDSARNEQERIGAIVSSGVFAFLLSIAWPFMAAALLVYRFAVAPKGGRR